MELMEIVRRRHDLREETIAVESRFAELILRARAHGIPWRVIGALFGTSAQGAYQLARRRGLVGPRGSGGGVREFEPSAAVESTGARPPADAC
ncbi:MAG: hypothetical protein ACYCO3_09330 [Mycobacteriales bacterium]